MNAGRDDRTFSLAELLGFVTAMCVLTVATAYLGKPEGFWAILVIFCGWSLLAIRRITR